MHSISRCLGVQCKGHQSRPGDRPSRAGRGLAFKSRTSVSRGWTWRRPRRRPIRRRLRRRSHLETSCSWNISPDYHSLIVSPCFASHTSCLKSFNFFFLRVILLLIEIFIFIIVNQHFFWLMHRWSSLCAYYNEMIPISPRVVWQIEAVDITQILTIKYTIVWNLLPQMISNAYAKKPLLQGGMLVLTTWRVCRLCGKQLKSKWGWT